MKTFWTFKACLLACALAVAGCDKQTPTPPSTSSQTAEQTAESVEELLKDLPEAAPKKTPVPNVQFHGTFGTNGALPTPDGDTLVEVDSKAVAELNLVAKFRVESAFAERSVHENETVMVQFGGEEADGLLVNVRYQGKTASRHIVPASNGPELVSNLDHTVDRLLDELGVPRVAR